MEPRNIQNILKEKDNQTQEKKQRQERSEWRRLQNLCTMRRRAQNAMKKLTESLQEISQVSKQPERDYARVFQDEQLYFRMLSVCLEAYQTSYKSKKMLANEENWNHLRIAALKAGISVSEKEMFNQDRRLALAEKLKRKGKRDGRDYLEALRLELLAEQHRPKSRWLVTCPECYLEQPPTIFINSCPNCGFNGPVMPDLYTP